jgi:hypothetical protein
MQSVGTAVFVEHFQLIAINPFETVLYGMTIADVIPRELADKAQKEKNKWHIKRNRVNEDG